MKKIFSSKEALLYVMAVSAALAFGAWMSLLNNFTVEVASFNGSQIGILQSLREIPGLLAFTVLFVLLIIDQQRLVYISMLLLGFGVAITGFFPSATGLYITTMIMSIGFHYLETLNQSLSLQWLDKEKAPIVLGKIFALRSFVRLFIFVFIYVCMNYLGLEYKWVFFIFGTSSFLCGVFAWIFFKHFKEKSMQEKKPKLKKEYWLFYLLTFLAGARRQIFAVFAGFLLVEKFGVDIHNMVALLFVNSILNMYIAPKIGKFIVSFGERVTLRLEYLGLVIIFVSYGLVENVYLAYFLYLLDHLLFAMAIALKTYFQKIANPKDIASASAVSFTINHIAAVFLPVMLGFVWLYSNLLVFLIGAFIALISFGLSFLIPKEPTRGYETTLVKN